jgi:hypothetical protein
LPRLIEQARALPHVHEEPAPDARIQDFRDRSVNVVLGAWCDTEHHPNLVAALALLGKQVLDEARTRRRLTPKSPRGDAAVE